ncbi:MAG: hypothetical protein LUG21_03605 [Clostridiales bacterium]|nr:hypothetical protein [Clostridiales bacterium]
MTEDENIKEFIKLVKSLNKEEQTGLLLTLEGLNVLAEKKKSGVKSR